MVMANKRKRYEYQGVEDDTINKDIDSVLLCSLKESLQRQYDIATKESDVSSQAHPKISNVT
eukprot:2601791-Amphidinium_carterae.1